MGLFDKITSQETTQNSQETDFKPIIVDTTNIIKELKDVALANHIKASELDFKLLKVTTFFSDEKNDHCELDEEKMKLVLDDAFLLNPHLKFTQHYRVEIYHNPSHKSHIENLPTISLSANKSLTKIIATVLKNHDVKFTPSLEAAIIEDINIKKMKVGILVGIRDHNMHKEVKKIVANLHVNGIIDQDYTFVVCQGIDEIPSVNDNLVFHYKKKVDTKNHEGKVDYSKRGYVLAVEQNECILEYIKPQIGTPGRNCRGSFIPVREPIIEHNAPISTTTNIVQKENDISIKYIANRGGFVNIDKGVYDIQDQMEINEITFKSTGSIDAKINSNIKINIKEKDILKDAIGAGMSVETTELVVEGNVGSGAKIKANIVTIGGQTHQSAFIDSNKITIAVHRGEANGEEVFIDRLEGGKVIGDRVHVKQMIGGEIIAREIKIDLLMSNAKVTAAELIEIMELKGNNNKLFIDPSVTKEFNQQIEETNKKISRLEEELKAYPRQLSTKRDLIEKTKPMAEMVKDKILELRRSGVEPPATLFAKIKDFQEKVSEYNTLLQSLKDKTAQVGDLKKELYEVQRKVFSAKIINHTSWKEFNEVRFRLISPPKDITYNPKEKELAKEISLKDLGDGEYRVIRSSGVRVS